MPEHYGSLTLTKLAVPDTPTRLYHVISDGTPAET